MAERRLRIAVTLSRRSWGGAMSMARDLANGLAKRGHAVTFLGHPRAPVRERLAGEVEFVPALHGRDLPLLGVPRVRRALRAAGIECVLCGYRRDLGWLVPATMGRAIPLALCWVAGPPARPERLERALWRSVDLHIANSRATAGELRARAPRLPEERVRVIHNGVDTEAIEAAAPAELGGGGGVRVGFVGRLSWEKGLPDLAAAWPAVAAAIPDAELVIAGGGAEEASLRERLDGTPRVRWLGFRPDGAAVMKAVDVVVVPSRSESFGLVAAEAMAAGRPVVATRVGGLPEVVRDGVDGVLVEPAQPARLADALIALCRDDARRARLGAAGRARARDAFDIRATVAAYEAALLRLVGER